nr:MAG TPA: DNA-directed RNA polymerase subunit beta' [Caudoviricetes sp.]
MADKLRGDHLEVSLLDMDDFVKKNNLQPITNPIFFDVNGNPTDDGLLSNIIFGITKQTRAGTFAYIDLHGRFLAPLVYKIWGKIDRKLKEVVKGTKLFKIDADGQFVEDENGETGLEFLYKNIDKVKFRETGATKRSRFIEFLERNRKNFFITKLLIIPPYYRDVKSDGGKVSVGDINKLYQNVLVSAKSLEESKYYGINIGDANKGRIQDLLLEIYNWFGSGTESNPNGGIPGKFGVLRRTNISKTTDYATRLVMSSPNLKVENLEDIDVDLEYSMLPMTSAIANFFPFVLFHMRRFFEEQFAGLTVYECIGEKGETLYPRIDDWQTYFNDLVLKKELNRFVHGYSDRFRPVEAPITAKEMERIGYKGKTLYMKLKARFKRVEDIAEDKDFGVQKELQRKLTWCDVIFMAVTEAVKDKMILITRFPIDTFYNQFTTKCKISSTIETESIEFDGKFYKRYPKIRDEYIGTNTANKFIDTMNICNAYLGSIGGDYDGDQIKTSVAFSDEANAELNEHLNSKVNFINLGCEPIRKSSNEAIQCLYNLTLFLPEDNNKLGKPTF